MLEPKDNTLDYDHILAVLTEKRRQIEEAISAIGQLKRGEANGVGTPSAPEPPPQTKTKPEPAASPATAKKTRFISEAGRQRIIDATKKRWADLRAAQEAAGTAVKKTAAKAKKKTGPRNKSV